MRKAYLAVILMLLFVSAGCTRIGPGHVGIVVNMAGSGKGVEKVPTTTGWTFYNPLTESVYEYPTYIQTAVWTKNPNEGAPNNEEITFTTKESILVAVDVSLSYSLQFDKVPDFYVKFRNDDLKQFTHGFLRNVVRDSFNEVGGKYNIDQVMGDNEPFIKAVREKLQNQVSAIGVTIEQFGLVGYPRPPQSVINAINAKVSATQQAMQRENELRAAEAEAKKTIAKAEGEAEANRKLSNSISPQLIEWFRLQNQKDAIVRWDGKRPMVEGSNSGLLLNIDPHKP